MSRRILSILLCLGLLAALFSLTGTAAPEAPELPEAPEVYHSLYPVGESWTASVRTAGQRDTALEGKSILFFGDSLTSGYGLDDYSQSWCGLLESEYGMEVTCQSIPGSTIASAEQYGYFTGGCYYPMVERELPQDSYDIIFVEGGGNDWYCATVLGADLDSRDPKTFMGAVNVLIDRIQAAYPSSLLVFMTSWEPRPQTDSQWTPEGAYYEAMAAICARRNVPCLLAMDPSVSGIYPRDPDFRQQYFLTQNDFWHLNLAGQALFLPTIAGWLEQQVRQHLLVADFYDVTTRDWFAEAVQYVYDNGLMLGTGPHSFRPGKATTRAMFVTMAYRAAGSPSVSDADIPFVDVPEDSYYASAVAWAYAQGFIKGTDERHFTPDREMRREELVTVLYRQSVGEETDPPALAPCLEVFPDADQISPYALQPMAWAVERGLIRGRNTGVLDPRGPCIRSEVATLFQRYLTES